eukprot:jgi/Botrbrau1/7496/Bobra.0095s0032.1
MGKLEKAQETVITREEWEKRLASVRVQKEDMDSFVMNFLVTEGYVEAATMLQKESGTNPKADLGPIKERMDIRRALQSGDVEQAIELVNDLNPEILERRHVLAFHLRQQRLIELIREDKTDEALEFAQEFLAPQGEEDPMLLEELERTITLLAFNNKVNSPLNGLLEAAQRQKTAAELNAAILSSQSQDEEARLPGMLRMLLWAQRQLDQREVKYPHISDLTSGELSLPS